MMANSSSIVTTTMKKSPTNSSLLDHHLLHDDDAFSTSSYYIDEDDFCHLTLFNDSNLTVSDTMETFDLYSLDSGFNSSFSAASAFSLHTPMAEFDAGCSSSFSSNTCIATTDASLFLFDAMLKNFLLDQFNNDLLSSYVEQALSLPIMLKNAFVRWSKSSLKRLGHSVLSRFLVDYRQTTLNRFVEYNTQASALVEANGAANDIDCQAIEDTLNNRTCFNLYDMINRPIDLIQNLRMLRLDECRANLLYNFYSYNSVNF